MIDNKGKWSFNISDDGIWFNGLYNTKEEAIAEGRGYYGDDCDYFYVGQSQEVAVNGRIYTQNLLEQIGEDVYEDIGEVAEDYLCNVKDEDEKVLDERLNKVFEEWATEFGYLPTFYKIGNVEKITVNE